jgi:hypothetical protein
MVKVTLNSGSFQYEEGTVKVNGSLTVNEKKIQNINGQVDTLGSFDAFKNGEDLKFNLHPVSIDKGASLVEAVQAAVAAVEGQL